MFNIDTQCFPRLQQGINLLQEIFSIGNEFALNDFKILLLLTVGWSGGTDLPAGISTALSGVGWGPRCSSCLQIK